MTEDLGEAAADEDLAVALHGEGEDGAIDAGFLALSAEGRVERTIGLVTSDVQSLAAIGLGERAADDNAAGTVHGDGVDLTIYAIGRFGEEGGEFPANIPNENNKELKIQRRDMNQILSEGFSVGCGFSQDNDLLKIS